MLVNSEWANVRETGSICKLVSAYRTEKKYQNWEDRSPKSRQKNLNICKKLAKVPKSRKVYGSRHRA